MRKYFFCLILCLSSLPFSQLIGSESASAASWPRWAHTCGNWPKDIASLDSNIRKDFGNWTNLFYDFIGIGVDGNHLLACVSSPDKTLDKLVIAYGHAAKNEGVRCASWASSQGNRYYGQCMGAITTANAAKNQMINRMSYDLG